MCTKPIFDKPLAIYINNHDEATKVLSTLHRLGFTWPSDIRDLVSRPIEVINKYIIISQHNVIIKRDVGHMHYDESTNIKFKFDLDNFEVIGVNTLLNISDSIISSDVCETECHIVYKKSLAHPHVDIILEYYTNFKNIEKVMCEAKVNGSTWSEYGNSVAFWPDNNYKLVYKASYQLVIGDNLVIAKSNDRNSLVEKMNNIKNWLDKEISIRITGEDE